MSVRHDATVKYYYLDTSGQQTGPVLLGALKELFAGKKIHTGTYLWNKTMPEWVPLSAVPVLLELLAPEPSPPPPPAAAVKAAKAAPPPVPAKPAAPAKPAPPPRPAAAAPAAPPPPLPDAEALRSYAVGERCQALYEGCLLYTSPSPRDRG